jgi:uncharacterized membrane protein
LASLHRILFLVFLFSFCAAFCISVTGTIPAALRPMLAMTLIFALLTTLLGLWQTLPLQNVLAVSILIAIVSSLIEIANWKTHYPFGHRFWAAGFAPRLLHLLPWPLPFLWLVIVLKSRGLAHLLLHPCRNLPAVGLWSLALSSILSAVLWAGIENAARFDHLWFWSGFKPAPWHLFFSNALVTALLLVLSTPWLLDKKRTAESLPDFHPLVVWSLLLLLAVVQG